jgi:hypothetical protein
MVDVPFLTLIDPRAKIKGSRDPLGLQILWTKLGRQVIQNLTTVTTSLRGFSVLLLGLYFAERAIAERQVPPERLADLFLKFEQLAAYSRVSVRKTQNLDFTEDEIRGIQRVKKNLIAKRVWISTDPASQILSNQKTYGLWGLYMVAARNSKLVQMESPRLTNEGRAFVAAEYDNQDCLSLRDSEQIIGFLCHDKWFEPAGKDANLAQKLAALFGKVTSHERHFYKKHLIECVDSEPQALLWQAMREVTSAGEPFSMFDLSAVIKHSQAHGQTELARCLWQVQIAESVFAPSAYLFDYILNRDGQTVKKIADQVGEAWGLKLQHIDPLSFSQVLENTHGEIDTTARTRLAELANSLAEGHYKNSVELLIKQNQAVMKARGGNPWATLKGKTVSVSFK